VIQPIDRDSYLNFAKECLESRVITAVLSDQTILKINKVVDTYGHLFPDQNEKQLVHADFDPANILVNQTDKGWHVSGILDWEFSFSGSVLCDVANMLRDAHHMPSEYETAFLEGLQAGGVSLPKNWRVTVHLLNLLALLDCLKRPGFEKRPNQCADIRELIDHILKYFMSQKVS